MLDLGPLIYYKNMLKNTQKDQLTLKYMSFDISESKKYENCETCVRVPNFGENWDFETLDIWDFEIVKILNLWSRKILEHIIPIIYNWKFIN